MEDLFSGLENSAEDTAPQGVNVLTVSQLSNQLRLTVERKFERIAVEGEISGLKKAASGHIYFSLKDDDNVLNAIVWRGSTKRIKAPFEEGLYVVAYGKITTYGARSNYQMIVDRMEPAGLGALMQRFEALKAELAEEGLFDEAHKKPLPFFPRTIGIITSSTGAVIEDMLNRLRARCPAQVLLWPVAVQGGGAKTQIAAAIKGFNGLNAGGKVPRPDVIIVARGGGSLEDLWAFNEEVVVRAVAGSAIPIISGVGHEPDMTLCDYAADHRSPTPTAAATEAVPDYADLVQTTHSMRASLVYFMGQHIKNQQQYLQGLRRGLPKPQNILNQLYMRLDDRNERLEQALKSTMRLAQGQFKGLENRLHSGALRRMCASNVQHLKKLSQRLESGMKRQVVQTARYLESRHQLLQHLSPKAPLEKGFVYVTGADGEIVKTAKTTQKDVALHFKDGARSATLGKNKPQN